MLKVLVILIGFAAIVAVGCMTMIFGWGVQPQSWGWIISGAIGNFVLAGLVGAAAKE